MVVKIRDDGPDIGKSGDATNWATFGYEGKKKIVVQASGDGGYDEWLASLKDDQAQYSLLRLITGDRESKRVKFVMILWLGPNLGMVSKGRCGMHKGSVKDFIGQTHIEMTGEDREELTLAIIKDKLKRSAGADYDLGSNSRDAAGNDSAKGYDSKAGEIQRQAKANYQAAEKVGNVGGATYGKIVKGQKMTACDLGGRAMTAPPSEAQANTSDFMKDNTGESLGEAGGMKTDTYAKLSEESSASGLISSSPAAAAKPAEEETDTDTEAEAEAETELEAAAESEPEQPEPEVAAESEEPATEEPAAAAYVEAAPPAAD